MLWILHLMCIFAQHRKAIKKYQYISLSFLIFLLYFFNMLGKLPWHSFSHLPRHQARLGDDVKMLSLTAGHCEPQWRGDREENKKRKIHAYTLPKIFFFFGLGSQDVTLPRMTREDRCFNSPYNTALHLSSKRIISLQQCYKMTIHLSINRCQDHENHQHQKRKKSECSGCRPFITSQEVISA